MLLFGHKDVFSDSKLCLSVSSVTNMSVVIHKVSAKEEFAKNPDLKREDLTSLRSWLGTQEHLPHITGGTKCLMYACSVNCRSMILV